MHAICIITFLISHSSSLFPCEALPWIGKHIGSHSLHRPIVNILRTHHKMLALVTLMTNVITLFNGVDDVQSCGKL